jgi:FkbM family methyltransferase
MDEIIYNAVVVHNEYNMSKLNNKDIIIDIGAHIGIFSKLCEKLGAGKILSFEPCLNNYNIARENLKSNKIKLYNKAVYRSDMKIDKLYLSRIDYDPINPKILNTGGVTSLADSTQDESASVIALDDILKNYEEIHTLKIDCEGAEFPILLTSKLLGKIKRIVGEYHELYHVNLPWVKVGEHLSLTRHTLKDYLISQGFDVKIRHPNYLGSYPIGFFEAWHE